MRQRVTGAGARGVACLRRQRRRGRPSAGAGLLAALAGGSVLAFEDAPPERATGGFGEDSCRACHFGSAGNDAGGAFTLSGLPGHFTPGERYTLTLTLARAGMAVAGFQMAVRVAGDGAQAGVLEVPAEERARVDLTRAREVQYAQHAIGGTDPVQEGTGRWTIQWRAPGGDEPVVVHAAAVAGDGDASQIGDYVYTLERTVEPAPAASADPPL